MSIRKARISGFLLEPTLAALAVMALMVAAVFVPTYCAMGTDPSGGATKCAKLCRPNGMKYFDSTGGFECVCATKGS